MKHTLSAAFAAALITSVAAFAGEIQVPCSNQAGSVYKRSCQDVLQGPNGLLTLIDSQIKQSIDDPNVSVYSGKIADESQNPPVVKASGAPVCNLMPNSFNNNQSEATTNHRGQSCGTPSRITVNGASFNVEVNPPKTGTLEMAYYRGAAVQATVCQWQAVRQEIQSGALQVSPLCESAGSLLESNMPGASPTPVPLSQGTSQVDQQMTNIANISEVWKCDDNTIDPNVTATSSVGMLKTAAQHHCAARADLEKAFAHVAACEIHSRALASFEKALAGDIRSNLEIIKQNVTQVCSNRCVSSCSYCASRWSGQESCFNNCATNCANDCYPGELKNFYAKVMSNWPNNGGCK